MKITKGTIIRTIALAVVLLNLILKALGKPLIDYDEGTVMYWLEYIIEIAVILVTFWKNNSFSENAIKADEFLKKLKNEEYELELDLDYEGEVE
jgi:SPP1 family holin